MYQDLERSGRKHVINTSNLIHAKTASQKVQVFHHGLRHLYHGLILFPETMNGLQLLFEELAAFPDGKHDDQVDALMIVAAYREKVLMESRRNAERFARWTAEHRALLEKVRPAATTPQYRSRYFDRNG